MGAVEDSKLRDRLSEYERKLQAGYVSRRLFTEGADPSKLAIEESLLKEKQPGILPDLELLDHGDLLILGNAGSGKSFIIFQTFIHAAKKYLSGESLERPLFLDCHKPLGNQTSLEDVANFDYGGFLLRVSHVLIVDGFDEGINQKGLGFIRDLGVFIDRHRDFIPKVIITCRRTLWNDDWATTLGFPEGFKDHRFSADYLEDRVYSQLIPDDKLRKLFIEKAQSLGILDLLDHPFEGFFLARRFVKGETLPPSRFECFNLQIDECLKGSQRDRNQLSLPNNLKRKWASNLAAVSFFGRMSSWSIQEALDTLSSEGSIEPANISMFLDCPLFFCSNHRYSFSHQLYMEFLAAEALKNQPLRKQRMLLSSDSLGTPRIVPELRGAAMFLYSFSNPFASWLRENDPLVAFMGEPTDLSHEQKEEILRNTIDNFITERRAPWHSVPPHGEQLEGYLAHHKPRNIALFLHPYLESESELSRYWGVFCAMIWGGDRNLNDVLIEIALDQEQPSGLRLYAVKAIEASRDEAILRNLYPLLKSEDDRLRAKTLGFYMKLEKPGPREFLQMLTGIKHQPDLSGTIELVALKYAKTLNRELLEEAFDVFQEHHEDFVYMVEEYLFKGLLERSEELGYEDIPVELIIKSWKGISLASLNDEIVNFLKPRIEMKHKIWNNLMSKECYDHFETQISRQLVLIAGEEFLDWIPDTVFPLADSRYWFIAYVLSSIYNNPETSKETKELMEKRFPDRFPEHFIHLLNSAPKKPSKKGIKRKIMKALEEKERHPALAVLEALKDFLSDWPKPEEIEEIRLIISEFPSEVKLEVLKVFKSFVGEVKYKIKKSGEHGWTISFPIWSIPFWILYSEGEKFSLSKIKEFLLCYGFKDELTEQHKKMLDELRACDENTWRETILEMMDSDVGREREVLVYLKEMGSTIYLERCGKQLRECSSSWYFPIGDCLEYWKYFRDRIPAKEYRDVLWRCYRRLVGLTEGKKESDRRDSEPFTYLSQFSPLFMLLEEDIDEAWNELGRRIQEEAVPIGDIRSAMVGLRFSIPNNPGRMPILADWYALCRRKEEDSMDSMSDPLRSAIIRVGGLQALQRIRELQTMQAYPNSDSDSPFIFNLEEGILSRSRSQHSSDDIMKMLQENKYIIKTEADLWEAVCDALEELKRGFEQGGYSSNPYWEGDAPKLEPGCHESLWPLLKEKLGNLGVSQVEEKLIRPNILDFQLEKPLEGNQDNLKVCIELKVARRSYGRNRLVDPIETQLWKRYMRPERSQHGIYIVLWFKSENYPYPKDFESIDELLKLLRNRRDDLKARERIQIEPYVIDMTR